MNLGAKIGESRICELKLQNTGGCGALCCMEFTPLQQF